VDLHDDDTFDDGRQSDPYDADFYEPMPDDWPD
jgi:hypothetical protein